MAWPDFMAKQCPLIQWALLIFIWKYCNCLKDLIPLTLISRPILAINNATFMWRVITIAKLKKCFIWEPQLATLGLLIHFASYAAGCFGLQSHLIVLSFAAQLKWHFSSAASSQALGKMALRIISTFNTFNWAAMCPRKCFSNTTAKAPFWSCICIPRLSAGLWGFHWKG